MAKKYYAVRTGRKTGVFMTWAECQKATSGYSGAEFRGHPGYTFQGRKTCVRPGDCLRRWQLPL